MMVPRFWSLTTVIIVISALTAFAGINCPQCGFENPESDRYCLECAGEMRSITRDEKKHLERADKDREKNTRNFQPLKKKMHEGRTIEIISAAGESVAMVDHTSPGGVTVFYFYADWCGACKQLAPSLEALVQQKQDVSLKKINIVNWNTPVVKQHGIQSIPSVWVFDGKKKVLEREHRWSTIQQAIGKASKS